jgi:Family of unknown function (DUF6519)
VASDRARISFDPSRQWRGVIHQQGRVTIEADINEASAIDSAERRAELLDVVGPSGTPDDGYKVLPGPTGSSVGDLSIQAGTMYVGGERVTLAAALDYAAQPDWVDSAGDPLWVAPAVPAGRSNEVVYLLLREQEVSAVEDPALIDIALGGPDTAARRRIVQRVVRAATTAADAAEALAALEQGWAAQGLTFTPGTMRLGSQAMLQVSFQQEPGMASLCQPSGQGGYIGAENQLIRVQVASVDASGNPTLVWGYDNASFLYRIAGPVTAGATTLTLASAPVDSYHQPAKGQAVEVLQAAVVLNPSDTTDYIAATSGTMTTLTAPYQPGSGAGAGQVQLATGLTAQQAASPLLFLRVWQGTIPYSPGPLALGQTGLQVTLTNSGSAWHVGDYWTFAVRPGTPTTLSPVYPERLLASPQPPDGPSMWACQLGLVSWSGTTPTVTDFRQQFSDLVTLTEQAHGCCTVEVTPDAVDGGATLQALIDSYANLGPTTICLQPGTYTLPAPLVVQAGATALTLEACMGGVVLEAGSDSAQFTLGLIVAESVLAGSGATPGTTQTATPTTPPAATTTSGPPTVTQAEDAEPFTVRGIVFSMPPVSFPISASAISSLPAQRQALLTTFGNGLQVSFGMSVLGCSNVTVDQCRFYFPDVGGSTNLFAAGIYATGTTAGVEMSDCSFINVPEPTSVPFSDMRLGNSASPPYQACFGYLQMPTQPPPTPTTTTTTVSGPTTTALTRDVAAALWRDLPLAEQTTAFEAPSVTERVESALPTEEERLIAPVDTTLPRISTPVVGPTTTTGTTATTTTTTTTTTTSTTSTSTTTAPPTTAGPPPPLTLTNAVLEDAVFTRNAFDGMTVPVLVLGRIGVVSVTDNIVRACYGGFWFVPADGDTAVALLDLLDSTDSSASDYAVQYGITALTDPVLWLGTALARLLPLTPPPPNVALEPRPIALPRALLGNASILLHALASIRATATTSTTTTPPGTSTVSTAEEAVTRAAEGLETEADVEGGSLKEGGEAEIEPSRELIEPREIDTGLEGGLRGGIGIISTPEGEAGLSGIDIPPERLPPLPTFTDLFPTAAAPVPPPVPIQPLEPGLGTTPRLDFHGNQVDAIVPFTYSGTGLLVAVMLTDGTFVSVLCSGNRIRARVASGPAASLNQVTQCTMTGNAISNEIVDPSAPASPEASIPPPTTAAAGTTAASTPPPTSPSLVLEPAVIQAATSTTTTPTTTTPAPAPTPLVAVTGNVLVGDPPTLPTRPSMPAGFGVWDVLNTIVAYVAPPTTTTTPTTAPS